jgi:TolB-like protein/ketosteroid isomerase-like protein
MNPRNFFAELKRRNVSKVAIVYAVVAWLLIQAASIVFPTFEAPAWVMKVVIVLVVLGFPVALILAWAVELTPEGMKRTENVRPDEFIPQWSGRKFAALIVSVAVIAAGLLLFQLFRSKPVSPAGAASAPGVPEKSIAVLPFESLSEDKSNAYFADGIQDEILARLSKIADLKVISRTSTQKYKSAPNNLREIAQQLGVTNVLEGSVQKASNQVRVTVQLINALNDSHLWAETYDRKLVDMFEVESDIAQKIAGSLEAKLTGREKTAMTAAGTKNPEAYDAYLHALAHQHGQAPEDQRNFVEYSQRAVALDPHYPEAWSLLAEAEAQLYFFPEHTEAQLARARTAAETALRIAPDLADAHKAMGLFYYYCLQDFDRALAELSVARERAPNDANVLLSIGLVQRRQGKLDDAIAIQLQASKLDPLNQDIWANTGRSYRGIRKFDDARAMFDRALTISPNDSGITAEKAETYLAQGDLDTTWRMLNGIKLSPLEAGFGTYLSALVYRRQFDDAIALISSAMADEQHLTPVFSAVGHHALGNLYLAKGDQAKAHSLLSQAESELKDLRAKGDTGLFLDDALIEVEARLGHRDEVQREADAMFAKTEKDKWRFPRSEEVVARAYAGLGDIDRAIPLLERALVEPCSEALTPAFLQFDPFWDPLRNDPRFQKLAKAKP